MSGKNPASGPNEKADQPAPTDRASGKQDTAPAAFNTNAFTPEDALALIERFDEIDFKREGMTEHFETLCLSLAVYQLETEDSHRHEEKRKIRDVREAVAKHPLTPGSVQAIIADHKDLRYALYNRETIAEEAQAVLEKNAEQFTKLAGHPSISQVRQVKIAKAPKLPGTSPDIQSTNRLWDERKTALAGNTGICEDAQGLLIQQEDEEILIILAGNGSATKDTLFELAGLDLLEINIVLAERKDLEDRTIKKILKDLEQTRAKASQAEQERASGQRHRSKSGATHASNKSIQQKIMGLCKTLANKDKLSEGARVLLAEKGDNEVHHTLLRKGEHAVDVLRVIITKGDEDIKKKICRFEELDGELQILLVTDKNREIKDYFLNPKNRGFIAANAQAAIRSGDDRESQLLHAAHDNVNGPSQMFYATNEDAALRAAIKNNSATGPEAREAMRGFEDSAIGGAYNILGLPQPE